MLGSDERLQLALELGYRYLNHRDRTEAEVRTHLESKRLEASVVEASLRALTEQGYLNDTRFARLFVEDKRGLEAWGSERIRRSLLARGIDRELVEQALAGEAPGAEIDRALTVLRRRFPSPPRDRRHRERAIGLLLRKGYDSELALDALAYFSGDAGDPDVR